LVGTYHRTRGVQRWGKTCSLGTSSAADRDLHGMDTTRRPVSETEDNRRLGRRACCAQDREKGRVVVLTMACVKAWSTGSMADALGRRERGGPGRRGRGPKAPQRGTRPPARSGVSSSFSVSSSRRSTLDSTAGAVTPNTAQSWRLDSLRVVAPGSIFSPRAIPSSPPPFSFSQAVAEDWDISPRRHQTQGGARCYLYRGVR
jgi:hypothetical protein